MATVRVSLTARDDGMLRAIDRCALTVRQLRTLSRTFRAGFSSDRRLQERLTQLTCAGLLRRFRYADPRALGQYYYTLTPESFYLIHGNDAALPGPGAFRETGIARHHHTHSLAECIVHTAVAARAAQVTVADFTRENALRLSIAGDELYPDSSFTLTQPGLPPFLFYLELDNSTEPLNSPRARESWLRKLRFYEELQNRMPARFRVLGIATKSRQRRDNIASLAASVAANPQRSLFLGAYLPEFLGNTQPLTCPVFTDHRGLHVSLLPSLTPPAAGTWAPAREVLPPEHALTMIGASAEVPMIGMRQ
jgi:Replication-relaxation